ncbi:MAG: DUF4262 domain-containing protein [Acidimicrobiia bacterium]
MNVQQFHREHMAEIRDRIAEHGYTSQFVLGEDEWPSWGYTIGLLDKGHPEAVIVGLDPGSVERIFRDLHDLISSGSAPAVGREHVHELGGIRCALVPVPVGYWIDPSSLLLGAIDYLGETGALRPENLAAVQAIWADDADVLPWEDGYDTSMLRFQKVLEVERPPWNPGGNHGSGPRRRCLR